MVTLVTFELIDFLNNLGQSNVCDRTYVSYNFQEVHAPRNDYYLVKRMCEYYTRQDLVKKFISSDLDNNTKWILLNYLHNTFYTIDHSRFCNVPPFFIYKDDLIFKGMVLPYLFSAKFKECFILKKHKKLFDMFVDFHLPVKIWNQKEYVLDFSNFSIK